VAARILYDAECPFCLMMAELVSRREESLSFESWQAFILCSEACNYLSPEVLAMPADKVRVFDENKRLIEGTKAWSYLLENYDDLKSLNWLAERLGLKQAVAQSMERSGRALRRLCFSCGPGRRNRR